SAPTDRRQSPQPVVMSVVSSAVPQAYRYTEQRTAIRYIYILEPYYGIPAPQALGEKRWR
ncbi:MAG: hypothetical protein SNJ68_01350, partial [Cyanobacteriota bacterium]